MDGLLDRLEELVDAHGEAGWEVEYHVSCKLQPLRHDGWLTQSRVVF